MSRARGWWASIVDSMRSSTPWSRIADVVRGRWALFAVAVLSAVGAAIVVQSLQGDVGAIIAPVLLAAGVGAVLGVVAMGTAQRSDTTIRSGSDLARCLRVPNLAVISTRQIPDGGRTEIATFADPNSVEAGGHRHLFHVLESMLGAPATDESSGAVSGKIVMVAGSGEGTSEVVANLAAAAALQGRRVAVVDGNLRDPSTHRFFRLRNDRGLATLLTGDDDEVEVVQRLDGAEHLEVLTAGQLPVEPNALLGDERLGDVMKSIASRCDLVVVDTPPLSSFDDAVIVAAQCDMVVLVAVAESSDQRACAGTSRRLKEVGANVIGSVLLRRTAQPDDDAPVHRHQPTEVARTWWLSQADDVFGDASATNRTAEREPAGGRDLGAAGTWPFD